MTREYIQKRIDKMSKRLQHYNDNYDTLYSKQYKLEKNRVNRADLLIARHEKMLAYYKSLLID
jgi:hypothetical protein